MLWSQHLVTKDTVQDFNNAVNQINKMQRVERSVIEKSFSDTESKVDTLKQQVSEIQSKVNSLDYTLYRLEYLLDRW